MDYDLQPLHMRGEAVICTRLKQEEEVADAKTKASAYNRCCRILDDGSQLSELSSTESTEIENEEKPPCPNLNITSHSGQIDTEEDTEAVIQELRHCLPAWVSRDQMLALVSCAGMNLVEIVNHFYEWETEYYEQVPTCKTSNPACQSILAAETAILRTNQVNGLPGESDGIRAEELNNSRGIAMLTKNSISQVKRQKGYKNKPSKKSKANSKQEPSGAKQCSITRFFNKVKPTGLGSEKNPI